MAHLDHVEQTMQTLSEHQHAIGAHETLNRYDVQSETNARMKEMDIEKEVEKYKSIPAIKVPGMNSYIEELLNSESFIRDQIKQQVKKQVEDEKLEWEFPGMILKTFNYEKHTGGAGIPTGTILRLDTSIYTVIDFDIRDPKAKEYLKPLILEHFQGKARIIETVSGGFHIYTRDDKIWSHLKKNRFVGIYKNEQLGFDIDVFVSGGLTSTVMLPGSKVRSSKLNNAIGEYKFLSHCGNSKLITMSEALEILHQKMEIEIPMPEEKEYERKSFTGKVNQNGLTEELFEAIVSCFNMNMSQIHTNVAGSIEQKLSIMPIITGFMGCVGELISEDKVNESLKQIEETGNFTEKAGFNWELMTEKIMAKCEPSHWRVLIKIIRLYNPKDFEARIVPLIDTKLEFIASDYTFDNYLLECHKFTTKYQHINALSKCLAFNTQGGFIKKKKARYDVAYDYITARALARESNLKVKIQTTEEEKEKMRSQKKKVQDCKLVNTWDLIQEANAEGKLNKYIGMTLTPIKYEQDETAEELWKYRPPVKRNYNKAIVEEWLAFMKTRVVHEKPFMEELYSHAYRLRNPHAFIEKFFIHYGKKNSGKSFLAATLAALYPSLANVGVKEAQLKDVFNSFISDKLHIHIEELENEQYQNKYIETLVKQYTTKNGSARIMYRGTEEVINCAIIGMNTNDPKLYGFVRTDDDAALDRLVIIEFKPSDMSKKQFRDKAEYFLSNRDFSYSLYKYLLEELEIPDDFTISRYDGIEKDQFILNANRTYKNSVGLYIARLAKEYAQDPEQFENEYLGKWNGIEYIYRRESEIKDEYTNWAKYHTDGKGIFAKENVVKELVKMGFANVQTPIRNKETGVVQRGIRIVRIPVEEFKKFNPDIVCDDGEDLEDVGMMDE